MADDPEIFASNTSNKGTCDESLVRLPIQLMKKLTLISILPVLALCLASCTTVVKEPAASTTTTTHETAVTRTPASTSTTTVHTGSGY